MTSILRFDGLDDWVRSGTLGFAFNAARTVAFLMRRGGAGVSGSPALSLIGVHSATLMSWAYQIDDSTDPAPQSLYDDGVGSTTSGATTIARASTDVFLVGYSTASGTAAPTFHQKNLTTGAASAHTAGGTFASAPRSASGGYFKIGNFDNTPGTPGSADDDFKGDIGLVAVWNGVNMSNTDWDALWANKKTSDLWNSAAGTPTILTELTSTTPTDLAGATTFTVTGATLTGTDPAGWTFDGTGGPAAQPVWSPHRMPMGV